MACFIWYEQDVGFKIKELETDILDDQLYQLALQDLKSLREFVMAVTDHEQPVVVAENNYTDNSVTIW